MAADDSSNEQTRSFTMLPSGTEVSHYRIVSRVGAGGMGEVYLAEDTNLKRQVALKFIPPHLADDHKFSSRFHREAQAAAGLRHPNIVTIHEVGDLDGRPFIAMEFVNGKSLRDIIDSGRVECERALDIMLQLCRGLKEAHSANVVHRDIKPSNIIVDEKGCCRILDFGLAKAADDLQATSPGTVMGTACYMSPEQGQGKEVDHRSDIFSLGIVFYEILTGCCPFKRLNIPATIRAVVEEEPDEISGDLNDDAARWQKIVGRMLTKDRAERYQSVDQILYDMDELKKSGQLPRYVSGRKPVSKPAVRSLAVLYLRNLGTADDEHLSYGITEDLIVDLTRVGTIRVAPMRSVLKFKDSDRELNEIARALDVELILDGSIDRTEGKVRASAQLVDVASGRNLWADRWEESPDRLHLVKTALAQGVSTALNFDSSVVKAAQVGDPEARSPKAYEYYLRGKYTYEHRHTAADVSVAADLFQRAIRLEPTLLAARAGAAEVMMSEGKYREAIESLLAALMEAQKRQQQADEGHILRLLARCFSEQSQWDEAAHYAAEAVRVSEELGDLANEAAALSALIKTRQRRAMFDEALQLYQRVLQINRKLNDREKEADALNLIGTVHLQKGDCEQAQQMYEAALEIARERDQASLEASCIGNIGTCYWHRANLDRALDCYEKSMRMFAALGDSIRKATTAHNIGTIHVFRGAYHKAAELYEKAAAIYERYGEKGRLVLAESNIAHVLVILGRFAEAVERLEKAVEMAENLRYPLVIVGARTNLGVAYACLNEVDQGIATLEKAIEIAEKAGLNRELATACMHLAEICYLHGRADRCYQYCEQSETLGERTEDRQDRLRCRAYLILRDISSDNYSDQLRRLQELVKQSEDCGEPRQILTTRRLLAEAMVRHAPEAAERLQGIRLLRTLATRAREQEIILEADRIEMTLDSLSD